MSFCKVIMVHRSRKRAVGERPCSLLSPNQGFLALRRKVSRTALVCLLAAGAMVLPGCVLFVQRGTTNNLLPTGQQPDKILYEKSIAAIKHGRYDVGRLTLQALLNTYPDSEYLAKAKLAIANSYYRQGGVAGLTEAESEYKDFITFFPTAPEAPMAQYRVAMAHFRLMGKPDRDLTQARLAQAEFKEFLLKYSDSPLMPRAKARLREVQEVLAEGEFEVAQFYYEKHANPGAKSRFLQVVNDYPSFSKADEACWYLARTYDRLNEPKKALPYYGRILKYYPLSPMAPKAKEELASLHQPIPQATKSAMARAEADATHNTHLSLVQKIMGTFSSAPNLRATRRGPVIIYNASNNPLKMAGNSQSGRGPTTEVDVRPVPDSTLNQGKAVDPAAGSKSGSSSGEKATSPKDKAGKKSEGNTSASKTSKKKSGRLHIIKRVLKPF